MDTSSWKWFRYDEIFDINSFRGDTLQDLKEGDIPYISTTEDNNGVIGHVDATSFCDGNKITVSRNGSVGISFYQPYKFYPSPDDIRIFTLKDNVLNPYIGLFLCVLIEKERYRYTYGRKFGTKRMKESLIKLPVTPDGTPDWKYMEDFVKDQIIPQLPKKAQKVWLQKYDTKPQLQEMTMKLNTDEWKEFALLDIFTIRRGKTLTSDVKESNEGKIPCVNGTSTNNGILCYLNEEVEQYGFEKMPTPSLSLCRVGTSGLTFVQTNPYYIADNAFCLQLKEQQNVYVYLFISALLDKECVKYCYGRTISSEKYMQTRIKLPVTPEGTPDWQFMEDYIKSLPYSKNIEPSKPNEIVDELMEVKKRVIEMQNQLQAAQTAQEVKIIGGNVTFNDYSTNYNVKK